MKKKFLVERLHEEFSTFFSKRQTYRMVNFLLQRMKEAIASEGTLKVSGFGTFRNKNGRILFKPSRKLLYRLKVEAKRNKM